MPGTWKQIKAYWYGPDGKPLVVQSRPVGGTAKTRYYSPGPTSARRPYSMSMATIVIAHSEKEQVSPTFKKTFGFHPLGCGATTPASS